MREDPEFVLADLLVTFGPFEGSVGTCLAVVASAPVNMWHTPLHSMIGRPGTFPTDDIFLILRQAVRAMWQWLLRRPRIVGDTCR